MSPRTLRVFSVVLALSSILVEVECGQRQHHEARAVAVADVSKDETLVSGASGRDVVEAVTARLDASCIFPDDKLFFRRLANVESTDGIDSSTFRSGYYGGIWQVRIYHSEAI